jgi:hypothetical protein
VKHTFVRGMHNITSDTYRYECSKCGKVVLSQSPFGPEAALVNGAECKPEEKTMRREEEGEGETSVGSSTPPAPEAGTPDTGKGKRRSGVKRARGPKPQQFTIWRVASIVAASGVRTLVEVITGDTKFRKVNQAEKYLANSVKMAGDYVIADIRTGVSVSVEKKEVVTLKRV